MRVIHVLQGLHAAGIEHLALQLIAHPPSGVQGILLNLDRSAQDLRPAFEREVENGRLRAILDCSKADGLRLLLCCLQIFRRERAQALVLYPFNRPMLWVALAARIAGIRQLRVHVGNAVPTAPFQRARWLKLLRWFQRFGVVAVPCSEAVARSFDPLPSGLRLGPTVPNGCDCRATAGRAAAARRESFPNARVLLMVARLDAIKDQQTLLRAFARAKLPGWELQLVGDGPRRSELEALITDLGLDAVVCCLGRRNDVPELLGQAELFAFSTTAAEGFGIALVEAMAAGLPVMASDVPACRELLADGTAGVLVPPADVDAWTQKLETLMADEGARQQLSLAARERANCYGIEACAGSWYAELLR